jgi:hypothetical protein
MLEHWNNNQLDIQILDIPCVGLNKPASGWNRRPHQHIERPISFGSIINGN